VDRSNDFDMNGNSITHGGWGATLQFVQKVLGGDNKLAIQYGRGGGTGFGTLARFYYPDFSVQHAPNEYRFRVVEVLTIQPTRWLGAQGALVFQRDDLGTMGSRTDWISAGGRVGFGFTEHAKLLGELGVDRMKRSNGSDAQMLTKATIAPTITAGRGFLTRPELRLFFTYAVWTKPAAINGVDSENLYKNPDENNVYTLSGYTFGVQAETWW
jgi:maltoporin